MVDDEPEFVRATVGMLAREVGEEHVRGTSDPREVVTWIETERPTALITDVRMPFVNGLELVQQLHGRWGPVPVIVMTAFPTARVDADAKAGRFAYLPKPFAFKALKETLQRICSTPASAAFSGAIAVSMLGEVVQLYGLAARTGTLRVHGPHGVGDIVFEMGQVVDARHASARGTDAFNRILSWTSGNFTWDPATVKERTIRTGLSELLIEAYRLRDEAELKGGASDAVSDDADADAAFDALFADEPAPTGNVTEKLKKLEGVEGFLAAAVYDMARKDCVAAIENDDVLVRQQVNGHAEVVVAKRTTIQKLKLDDDLEDIIITMERELHLLRLCRRHPQVFFFLVLNRQEANLAMARYLLASVEADVVL